jgi:hypothetical protein
MPYPNYGHYYPLLSPRCSPDAKAPRWSCVALSTTTVQLLNTLLFARSRCRHLPRLAGTARSLACLGIRYLCLRLAAFSRRRGALLFRPTQIGMTAVIRTIEARALEDDPYITGNKPLHRLSAGWAYRQGRLRNGLYSLKPATLATLVFICRHARSPLRGIFYSRSCYKASASICQARIQ